MHVILALGRQRQEDPEFEDSLGYKIRLSPNTKKWSSIQLSGRTLAQEVQGSEFHPLTTKTGPKNPKQKQDPHKTFL